MNKTPEFGVPDSENPEWTAATFKKAKPLKDLLKDLSAKSTDKQIKPAKHRKAA